MFQSWTTAAVNTELCEYSNCEQWLHIHERHSCPQLHTGTLYGRGNSRLWRVRLFADSLLQYTHDARFMHFAKTA